MAEQPFRGDGLPRIDVLIPTRERPMALAATLAALIGQTCRKFDVIAGLSFQADKRPHQQAIEYWDGPVRPEYVTPDGPAWQRHQPHGVANLWYAQQPRRDKGGVLPSAWEVNGHVA